MTPHVFSLTVAAAKRGYVGMCNGRSAQQESGAALSKNSMFTAGAKNYIQLQELMKEGASNCVERHLMIATLPFYGHILKWGVSVVFIANALHRAPYASVRTCIYGAGAWR